MSSIASGQELTGLESLKDHDPEIYALIEKEENAPVGKFGANCVGKFH